MSRQLRRLFSGTVISGMIICFIIICLKLYWALHLPGDKNDPHFIGKYHNVGDAIGGITAPLIGILSALLVYFSFQQQIKANEFVIQFRKDDIKNRKEDLTIQDLKDSMARLEERYNLLIRLFDGKIENLQRFIHSTGVMSDVNSFFAKNSDPKFENWTIVTAHNLAKANNYVLLQKNNYCEIALTWAAALHFAQKLHFLWKEHKEGIKVPDYLMSHTFDFVAFNNFRIEETNQELLNISNFNIKEPGIHFPLSATCNYANELKKQLDSLSIHTTSKLRTHEEIKSDNQ